MVLVKSADDISNSPYSDLKANPATYGKFITYNVGAQWLSGRVLDSRPRGRGFEPHRRHCVGVLEQDTFILAYYWFKPGRLVPVLTERLLMGCKELNQTNKQNNV